MDAYERKLVKQIEVASLQVKDFHNTAFIKLLKTNNKKSPITATIELDVNQGGTVRRVKKTVKQNDDLYEIARREVYEGYIIQDIYCEEDNEYISFTSRPEFVRLGASIGEINEDELKQKQIRKTIEEHLNKELLLNPRGIKVLSLFFIDSVSNYRSYDEDGNAIKGKYARIFEEEYKKAIQAPMYRTLFGEIKDIDSEVEAVHNGYFSIDNKGKVKDTRGNTLADDDTYSLIMKDKERLLSFDSRLRFIFSHSALREGWDNPNVFQICTLNESSGEIKKRQEIGRGLRLCVNQDGERIHGFETNTLTVMANESYEDFAAKLQKEIEQDLGIRFGVIEEHTFAGIVEKIEEDDPVYLGQEKSSEFYDYLLKKGYIDLRGKVQDLLRVDLKDHKVEIPEALEHVRGPILQQLRKIAGNLNIKNADDKKRISINKEVFLSPQFEALWNKIKYKTTYSVDFDSDKLIEKCAKSIRDQLVAGKAKWLFTKAKTEITAGGVDSVETASIHYLADDDQKFVPDIVSYIQNETNLTRRSIVEILTRCERLNIFKRNPQRFIDECIRLIRTEMRNFIIDGIKYEKIGEHDVYMQELFEKEELYGHLKQNMIASAKSPYEYVVYDSGVESGIVTEFEKSDNVKVYSKLPSWFKIETPLGTYNPDWAVLWEYNGQEKLYFILETKGALSWDLLRGIEKGKIECGQKHFEALGEDVRLEVANSFETFVERL